MGDTIKSVTKEVEMQHKYSVDLDQALAVAGVGWYNIKYCFVLSLFLIAPILESVGYSFVLPAAVCDLNMSDNQRGVISSIPYIGIVLTSFPWGYLVDTKGRKRVLIYSSLGAGILGTVSSFMPDLTSFACCKFLTALCIGCPAAIPYSYIGEILPKKHRDLALTVVNTIQILGTVLVPLLAWAILSLKFRINFGVYSYRPWRLLIMAYSMLFIIAAAMLSVGPESPKYFIANGQHDEALKVLQAIYAGNRRKHPEDYPIKSLKMSLDNRKKENFIKSLKDQSLPLLKTPYLKWMCLNGFLLFGVFSVLNGLFAWIPDILNRVMSEDSIGKTACDVIFDRLNQTISDDDKCNDKIDEITFILNTIANLSCFVIAIAVSSLVKFVDKKILLLLLYTTIGTFCMLINFVTRSVLFAVLLSPILILSLAIGPITAYSVQIFPASLRGMAVSLTMMVGRMGSIFGANITGSLLNVACEATFYSFGCLLIFCGILSLFLPNSKGFS